MDLDIELRKILENVAYQADIVDWHNPAVDKDIIPKAISSIKSIFAVPYVPTKINEDDKTLMLGNEWLAKLEKALQPFIFYSDDARARPAGGDVIDVEDLLKIGKKITTAKAKEED